MNATEMRRLAEEDSMKEAKTNLSSEGEVLTSYDEDEEEVPEELKDVPKKSKSVLRRLASRK